MVARSDFFATTRLMSDEPKKRSRGWVGSLLFAVFVLYPLSMGPVWWASDHFHLWVGIGEGWQFAFYAPLIWIGERVPAFLHALIWYLRFFSDLPE